jgi:hypothetical protein
MSVSISPCTRHAKDSEARLGFAAAGVAVVVAGILGMTAPFVVLKTPLPYMATPGIKIQKALAFLGTNNHKRSVFVDLGSGDGEALYQASRMGYQKVIGYELNWTLWGISQLRRILFWDGDSQKRRNTQILLKDFFLSSLPQDTCTVMVFGVTPLMKPLSAKLALETRPGVHVLSYRFPLPLKDESNTDLLQAKLVYDQEEMRIYKVIDDDESRL